MTYKSPKPESICNGTNWVMIVDDEFDIVSTLKQGLEKKGFQAFGFTEPSLALEHFRLNLNKYGVLISDLRMPGMNGFDLSNKLKRLGQK
jgi:FixJ family two-component response regulator